MFVIRDKAPLNHQVAQLHIFKKNFFLKMLGLILSSCYQTLLQFALLMSKKRKFFQKLYTEGHKAQKYTVKHRDERGFALD